MKKNRMTFANLGFICIFLIAALMIVTAAQAGEKTVKSKTVASITKMEVIPIPDAQGHVIGVLERRGVTIRDNGETAAYHAQVMVDSFKGKGTFSGYANNSYEDGSTTIAKCQGTMQSPLAKGTCEYIKGTGRFEGIKGKYSFSCKSVTPYTKDTTKGDAIFEATVTYTLPKK